MNKYEVLYIISADETEEKREELIKKFASYVEGKGVVVNGIDKWGMKKLAYDIKFKSEGFYVLMNFEADENAPKAITAKLNISKKIVRHMIVAK